ncbi:MAG: NADPH-dependent F420 reductase [Chloroflexi bacterium]|nr:NADPH-dependent F420 reductase [Chloroflexota bacterium]
MIGIVGGTGPEGRGLALRFCLAGEEVFIGSRAAERGRAAAEEIRAKAPGARVDGGENREAARLADIALVAVPYQGHREAVSELRQELSGKVVVDVVAPLAFSSGRFHALTVPEGSVAQQLKALAPEARVVAAFHTVSAADLLVPDRTVDCDVVVCSDDREAKQQVMTLAKCIKSVRAVDGSGLECARYIEDLTALLLNINRIYKGRSMIKIVGI